LLKLLENDLIYINRKNTKCLQQIKKKYDI
ncbi:unnamed protein product, partial [marine sediment metagenome]